MSNIVVIMSLEAYGSVYLCLVVCVLVSHVPTLYAHMASRRGFVYRRRNVWHKERE